MVRIAASFLAFVLMSSCVSPAGSPDPRAGTGGPPPQGETTITRPAPTTSRTPAEYAALPGWSAAQFDAPLSALKKSCGKISARAEMGQHAAPLGEGVTYAGRVSEWAAPCNKLLRARSGEDARRILEQEFSPIEITVPDGKSKFTGYFEPEYVGSFRQTSVFSEPIPGVPDDLVIQNGKPYQRMRNGKLRPYPSRAQISAAGVTPIGYARPSDVFFAQIQGSARFRLDGRSLRAAYAANNGHKFVSTANWLIAHGWIKKSEASMQGITAWMNRADPVRLRQAMNANPRFVFFKAEQIANPNEGPNGSANVPLTAMGSMAIDKSIHALGTPFFVETTAPALGGKWSGVLVAQDTGGAIKGPVRGDIYFGTGAAAGEGAGRMNAPGRMWALLPKAVAARLQPVEVRPVSP